jgi:AcrR family transcriptional regulator
MVSRQKLLDAAARVYSTAGFRGATTRRIADEAGLNEVTIFRLFGSKAALLAEAVRHSAPGADGVALPRRPVDPERELTAWASAQLDFLRDHGALLRKSLAEVEELPGMGVRACEGCMKGRNDVRRYAKTLCARWGTTRTVDLDASVAMLIGAIMSDAIARDVMPAGFPEPAERAASAYARVFLRAIGMPAVARRANSRPRRAQAKDSRDS